MPAPALLWFRNDLRLDDNVALDAALHPGPVIPVYIFDPATFGRTRHGFPKTGAHRARFLRESVLALRESLRRLGGDLLIRWGRPAEELARLARETGARHLHASAEVTDEELRAERAVAKALTPLGVTSTFHWQATLYHPEDLPIDSPADIPDVYTQFRKMGEKRGTVRMPIDPPREVDPVPQQLERGELPTWQQLGLDAPAIDARAVLPFRGGEPFALRRLDEYFFQRDCLREYKETRNGLLGADYSSKFSPWLANGCLSPRRVYGQVRRYEATRIANKSTYWLVFELLWRDFFRFIAWKGGNRLFKPGGLRGAPRRGNADIALFQKWAEGKTGYPFIDANMRELAATGYMSNRGRQNVASFLVRDLGLPWLMGAELFESLLLDYDPCSNYGNWNYVAGVGNDPREDRYFHVLKQARNYDPGGAYVRHWLTELRGVPPERIHTPWEMTATESREASGRLGTDYPQPVVGLRNARGD